jgi:hypothetical protein
MTNKAATFVGQIDLFCYSCEYFESVLSYSQCIVGVLKWYVSIEEV